MGTAHEDMDNIEYLSPRRALLRDILICLFKTVMFFIIALLFNVIILLAFSLFSGLPQNMTVKYGLFSLFTVISVLVLFAAGKFSFGFKKASKKDFILPSMIFVVSVVAAIVLKNPISMFILSNWNYWLLTFISDIFQKEIFNSNASVVILIFVWLALSGIIFIGMREKFWEAKHKKILKISMTIFFAGVLAGFNIVPVIYNMTPRMFTRKTYPIIDGATASIPFGRVLAQELCGIDYIASERFVNFNTTHDAYMNLIEKRADIIFVAEPSADELAEAEKAGVKLTLTPIGRDAFIFIVNGKNPVDNLTVEQIRNIYRDSPTITNWSQVGGNDKDIIAYQRTANSGSQTIMEKVVMKGVQMTEPPKENRTDSMAGMMEVVSDFHNSDGALGYNIYFYASEMNRKENVKFLSINGIQCNKSTIKDGTYPFGGNLYAVTRENDVPENARQLLDWILTEEGQKSVEKGGFVAIYNE